MGGVRQDEGGDDHGGSGADRRFLEAEHEDRLQRGAEHAVEQAQHDGDEEDAERVGRQEGVVHAEDREQQRDGLERAVAAEGGGDHQAAGDAEQGAAEALDAFVDGLPAGADVEEDDVDGDHRPEPALRRERHAAGHRQGGSDGDARGQAPGERAADGRLRRRGRGGALVVERLAQPVHRLAEAHQCGEQRARLVVTGIGAVAAAALDAAGVQEQPRGAALIGLGGLEQGGQPGRPQLDVDEAGADGAGGAGFEEGELVVGGER